MGLIAVAWALGVLVVAAGGGGRPVPAPAVVAESGCRGPVATQ